MFRGCTVHGARMVLGWDDGQHLGSICGASGGWGEQNDFFFLSLT